MCVIIVKPKDAVVPDNIMEYSAFLNPDGIGVYSYADKPKIFKAMDYESAQNTVRQFNRKDVFSIFHFRLATAGTKTIDNVHPFPIDGGWYLFQNGTVDALKNDKKVCDTMLLAAKIRKLRKLSKNVVPLANLINRMDKSRYVLVKKDRIVICNKSAGVQRYGCWFSKANVLDMENTQPLIVYGTLKSGEDNDYMMEGATLIDRYVKTYDKYPLIVRNGMPMLLDEPGKGENVTAQYYLVSPEHLEELDYFEGLPVFYKRKKIKIEVSGGYNYSLKKHITGYTTDAWVYFYNDDVPYEERECKISFYTYQKFKNELD